MQSLYRDGVDTRPSARLIAPYERALTLCDLVGLRFEAVTEAPRYTYDGNGHVRHFNKSGRQTNSAYDMILHEWAHFVLGNRSLVNYGLGSNTDELDFDQPVEDPLDDTEEVMSCVLGLHAAWFCGYSVIDLKRMSNNVNVDLSDKTIVEQYNSLVEEGYIHPDGRLTLKLRQPGEPLPYWTKELARNATLYSA